MLGLGKDRFVLDEFVSSSKIKVFKEKKGSRSFAEPAPRPVKKSPIPVPTELRLVPKAAPVSPIAAAVSLAAVGARIVFARKNKPIPAAAIGNIFVKILTMYLIRLLL